MLNAANPERKWWGLMRRRECWVPTWRAGLAVVLGVAICCVVAAREIYPFLAVNDLRPGGVLVVEGWAPDFAFQAAIEEFRKHHYDKIYVTGGPMEVGSQLSAYQTHAQLGAQVLFKMGMATNEVQPVPSPEVRRDRTWAAAATLSRWLREQHAVPKRVQLVTEGAHARRSRLLFQRAFGKGVEVGVTAVPVRDYNPKQWWRSSAGFRNVVSETLAYFYARVLFETPREQP
ncbi:MAG TPA: ElyC/SanA/YdcF family protein [Verrucomicrobiae bacterium]|nr:ElyC/SanA/YdcF family protein [Verrucomicrobiae bacterium]